MKTIIHWSTAIFALLVVNLMIVGKERTIAEGQTVLLKLAPRDPRSLMQGDYMVLRYDITIEARRKIPSGDGNLILQLDDRQVGSFVEQDSGRSLAANEIRLRYRHRDFIRIGAEAYFFQEGAADKFARAEYGELKVAANGESVLVGLRDKNLTPIN